MTDTSPTVDLDDITRELLTAQRAQRAEYDRAIRDARDRYMHDPTFRARVVAVKRALAADGELDRDRALDLAIRALVAADAAAHPHAPRGRIAVVATTINDVTAVARAADIAPRDVVPYTIRNGAASYGHILRGAVIAPEFASRLAQGDAYAYDVLMRVRRDLAKTGLRL